MFNSFTGISYWRASNVANRMNVVPTLEGGLKIEVESSIDWIALERIAPDALSNGKQRLPARLGALMDEGAEWDELVVPELEELFTGQLRTVRDSIEAAQQEPSTPSGGTLVIRRAEGVDWYGALNQARMALESCYQFGTSEENVVTEEFPPPKRSAYIRSQFYQALQSVLLEHLLD